MATQTLAALMLVTVLNVHDGDTFKVDLPCDVELACKSMPIRIYGIDTPEINDKRPEMRDLAVKARDRVRDLTGPDHKVELRLLQRDARYRLDAAVFSDGQSVAEILKTEGLAKPYFGHGAKPW